MTEEERHEYSEHLWITTGICGDDQESSFMNATLQSIPGCELEFSVAVHVGVPSTVGTEEQLRDYLRDAFQKAIDANDPGVLNVEIQLGRAGGEEDEAPPRCTHWLEINDEKGYCTRPLGHEGIHTLRTHASNPPYEVLE